MENQKIKFSDLANALEQISEDQHGMLIGGFAAISASSIPPVTGNNVVSCPTNNCNGGNCVAGCGGGGGSAEPVIQ